jgi:hypothetical protein
MHYCTLCQAVANPSHTLVITWHCFSCSLYEPSALQWLRHEGAVWPEELQYDSCTWPDDMVAWCRDEGCDSPLSLEVEVENEAIVD